MPRNAEIGRKVDAEGNGDKNLQSIGEPRYTNFVVLASECVCYTLYTMPSDR